MATIQVCLHNLPWLLGRQQIVTFHFRSLAGPDAEAKATSRFSASCLFVSEPRHLVMCVETCKIKQSSLYGNEHSAERIIHHYWLATCLICSSIRSYIPHITRWAHNRSCWVEWASDSQPSEWTRATNNTAYLRDWQDSLVPHLFHSPGLHHSGKQLIIHFLQFTSNDCSLQ